MKSRLWYMNADFEMELAANSARYKCPPNFLSINHRLAERLLWLSSPGDALLIDPPWSPELLGTAKRREVELVSGAQPSRHDEHTFTPWGWTPTSLTKGATAGPVLHHPDLDVVRLVNSKLWSFELECELDIAIPGSSASSTFEELEAAVALACPGPEDKWVIKSPYGFAARDRVLGRGPVMAHAQAQWAKRRFTMQETLLFQPWLEVKREYGIVMELEENGRFNILGISDLQTNGAGTGIGYLLGRKIKPDRMRDFESIASMVAPRLTRAGYFGPVGIDALEHTGGLLPLLEINARYTMGFIAIAVERATSPRSPVLWSTK
jgi:hypothetical protein